MTRTIRSRSLRVAALFTMIAGALWTTACAAPAAETLPPVTVSLQEIDGSTVEVALGNTINLTGDDETFTDWTADIAEPSIVEFVPGKDDGSAQFNPGLDAREVGTTEVTLSNETSGDSVRFTVEVVPGS